MGIAFDNNNVYMLEDERVLLRPLQTDDVENLQRFAYEEPELWKYSMVNPATSQGGMQAYIHQALAAKNEGKEYPFIVFDKVANEYAGSTRFYDINLPFEYMQLGYTWYGKAFQRTGLNRHCKYLLLQFAFETIGLARVEFRADTRNARSIAAMKAIGCIEEGVMRSNMPLASGGRRDSIILSILKKEWFEKVKNGLQQKIL